jgi:hypothetical protein
LVRACARPRSSRRRAVQRAARPLRDTFSEPPTTSRAPASRLPFKDASWQPAADLSLSTLRRPHDHHRDLRARGSTPRHRPTGLAIVIRTECVASPVTNLLHRTAFPLAHQPQRSNPDSPTPHRYSLSPAVSSLAGFRTPATVHVAPVITRSASENLHSRGHTALSAPQTSPYTTIDCADWLYREFRISCNKAHLKTR